MGAIIYTIKEGDPRIIKTAQYSVPPKKALIAFIYQTVHKNFNTWEYPDELIGMRESTTATGHWYFDVKEKDGRITTYAAYPA